MSAVSSSLFRDNYFAEVGVRHSTVDQTVPVQVGPTSGTPRSTISVLIVVEVCLYRDGLDRALSHFPELTVVGSTADADEAGVAIRELQPNIVLLDPAADPEFTLVSLIEKEAPVSRIVALGVREVERDVLRCAEAGVAAYVPREASIADLVAVIESAANGELHCSPRIAGSLFRRLASLADRRAEPDTPALTPREREIAALIDEGLSNKQIAQRLQIGLSTVKNHVHNLLTKLKTSRRTAAAARVRRAQAASLQKRASP